MKRAIISIGLSVAAVFGSAGTIGAYFAFGDATTAALNNSSVGAALPTDRPVVIPKQGSSSIFQMRYRNTGTEELYMAGIAYITFDTGLAGQWDTEFGAYNNGNRKGISVAPLSNLTNNVVARNIDTKEDGLKQIFVLGDAYTTTKNTGVSPIGYRASFAVDQVGSRWAMVLKPGQEFRAFDIKVTNRGLTSGEIFGDSSAENGLTLLSTESRAYANCLVLSDSDYDCAPTVKYAVQVVPEPSIFVGFGLLSGWMLRKRPKR